MILSALMQALFGCFFGGKVASAGEDHDDDDDCNWIQAGRYVSAPTQLMPSQTIRRAVLRRLNRDVAMRNSDTIVLHILFQRRGGGSFTEAWQSVSLSGRCSERSSGGSVPKQFQIGMPALYLAHQ